MKRKTMIRGLVIFCLACLTPAALFAQAARDAVLQVTVLDETRGVLPGATVTVAGIDSSNKAAVITPAATSPQGLVKFESLAPGRYSITAEFSGFQTRTMPDVRIRSGENKQVVVLPIDRLMSSVTVERDRQTAASERDVTFGTVMTREQIEALSDDPDELRRQLEDIAGPGAKLLIDSFEGRDLPPKALIKSIRVTRDTFAPEVHFAGEIRIEILTQPGIGPVRGNLRSGFYDSLMDGENPLSGQTGPAQSWQYGIGLSGTLISERASFNINFNGNDSYTTPVLYAATPFGQVARNSALKSPADNYFFNGGVDYALTRDQVLRVNFQGSKFDRGNAGIGANDLPERAYTAEDSQFGLFLQQNGPIGRRFVLNTRAQIFGSDSVARSAVEAPTVIVNDSFTSGGAQRRGGTQARNYWFNSDLDYVRGRHSIRTGIEVQAGTYDTDSDSNYLGTYVFASLDAFDARTPRSYSRRLGDPNLSYSNVQGGAYIQDDFKIRKNLTVTGGVRYEAQTHVPDKLNFAPRAGVTWAPFKSGKTTLRGSWGMFYDWLPTGTYSADDPGRRRPPARAQHRQSDIPRSGRCRIDDADQPLPPRRRTRHGVFTAAERGHRAGDFSPVHYERALQLRLSLFLADGTQYQHTGQWCAARSPLRQRRSGDVGRARAAAHGECVGEPQSRTASADRRTGGTGRRPDHDGRWRRSDDDHDGWGRSGGDDGPALPVESWADALRLLHLRPELRQYRRCVRDPVDHLPGRPVGADGIRSPPQYAHRDHQHGAPQPHCARRRLGVVRAAADDSQPHRRQRRPGVQRSSRRRRPQLGANDGHLEYVGEFRLLVHTR